MRNQTSFRLTTTLLPGDMAAKTTTVINKLDSDGNKFYPSFTEETVVITNDDRTMMETTRAICTDGVLTFIKRGLSDDGSQTQVPNRKLQWNPGSLCFITIGAGDIIDTGDDLYWNGDQTYEGAATFNGLLTTNKGVKYPSFENQAAMEAYPTPFAGMFATLDSDGELYRYNAVTEQWDVVTTSTPVQPEKATTSTIGIVRGATDEEFAAGTSTGSSGELLVATPSQIMGNLNVTEVDLASDSITTGSASVSYTVPRCGFLVITWTERVSSASAAGDNTCNSVTYGGTAPSLICSEGHPYSVKDVLADGWSRAHRDLVAVGPGTFTATMTVRASLPGTVTVRVRIRDFFYFG